MKALAVIRPLLLIIFYCVEAKAQSISGIVNSYYHVTVINTVSNTLTLSSTSGLSVGTKVLMIQMKGAAINSANASTFGDLTAINNAGNHEFNIICSITGNDVFLKYQILKTYDVSGQVQLVSVPVYSSVTIAGPVTSTPWDPSTGTGGIVAIEATNTIFLNSSIDVSGQGFLGGALQNYLQPPYDCTWAVDVADYFLSIPPSDTYHTGGKKGEGIADYIVNKEYGRGKLSNGGGGGNNQNTGGAGGGNYGKGGDGGMRTNESTFKCHGHNPGVGGLALSGYGYSAAQNRIFVGGGGGAGHENNALGLPGGNGGGIVILAAALITGSGQSVLANGVSPINPSIPVADDQSSAQGDGGGGGGAGGTVIINAPVVSGNIIIQANGARGSDAGNIAPDCMGPGGGGGAGVIWAAGSSFPSAITGTVNGGTNGLVSLSCSVVACRGTANGATAGANGNMQTAYTAPMGTAEVCALLASSNLEYFRGTVNEEKAILSWGMYQTEDLASYTLESSFDRVGYTILVSMNDTGEKNMEYEDSRKWTGTVYYRLRLLSKNGQTSYSAVLPLTRTVEVVFQMLTLQPNPVQTNLAITLYAKKKTSADVILYNSYGQKISAFRQEISAGYSAFTVPVSGLAPGAYMILMKSNGTQLVKPFLKIQ